MFPEGATDSKREEPAPGDWIAENVWLNDEQRLMEYYWLTALGVDLKESSWLDYILYDREHRGKIPEWLSSVALAELEKQKNSVTTWESRKEFLEEIWIPFVKDKR